MPTPLEKYQAKNRPKAKLSETHLVPNERLLDGGLLDARDDPAGFLEAVSAEVTSSRLGLSTVSVYEKLRSSFKFFVQVTIASATDEWMKRLFELCGRVLSEADRGDDVFFPRLATSKLRCVVLSDSQHVRLVFPDVVVDLARARQLHRYFLHMLNEQLTLQEKMELIKRDSSQETYSTPAFSEAYSVLSLDTWKTIAPNDVYVHELGVPMCGSTAVARCTAVTRRAKGAHNDCETCARSGFVPVLGRIDVVAVLEDATNPRLDEADTARLKTDAAAAVRTSMLHTTEALTEPFCVPSYAPAVPMQTDRQGQEKLSDVFESERTAFGPPSRASQMRRTEIDVGSRSMQDIKLLVATQRMCRRMHRAYSRVTIRKMYKLNTGMQTVVRVQVDGVNSCFCMRKQQQHAGASACRASFTIEMVQNKPRMYQECFSAECTVGRKRYRSNAKEIPRALAALLGFAIVPEREEDKRLYNMAKILFAQMRA